MPISVYRGDNKTIRVSITDANCIAVDTTGWTIDFTLRASAEAATALVTKSSLVAGEIDAVDESEGIWDISLLPADTNQVIGILVFDVQATTDDGTPKIFTVVVDTLEILQDVTRP